jgi:hypothetical protein
MKVSRPRHRAIKPRQRNLSCQGVSSQADVTRPELLRQVGLGPAEEQVSNLPKADVDSELGFNSVSKASRLSCANAMLAGSENVALTPPNGFAEEPDPSRFCSMTKTLPAPARARWNAVLTPMTPPPMIATKACGGSGSGGLGSSTELCPRSNTVVLVYAWVPMGICSSVADRGLQRNERVVGQRTARSSASIAAAQPRSLRRNDFFSVASGTLVA